MELCNRINLNKEITYILKKKAMLKDIEDGKRWKNIPCMCTERINIVTSIYYKKQCIDSTKFLIKPNRNFDSFRTK